MKKSCLVGALLIATASMAHAQDSKIAERAAVGRMKGPETASVTVYEISDLQCPFCARFAREVYPQIDNAYVKTGKVRWIFVNLPLPMHGHSWVAAEAAMCAGGAGEKFWPMHDRIFAGQADWSKAADPGAIFSKYAKELGVPMDAYNTCVANDLVAPLLVRDVLISAEARVTGTPAFVVQGEPTFAGVRSFEEWQTILDAALKKNAAGTR
jgi:protein-disulfide isomerase